MSSINSWTSDCCHQSYSSSRDWERTFSVAIGAILHLQGATRDACLAIFSGELAQLISYLERKAQWAWVEMERLGQSHIWRPEGWQDFASFNRVIANYWWSSVLRGFRLKNVLYQLMIYFYRHQIISNWFKWFCHPIWCVQCRKTSLRAQVLILMTL